MNTGSSNWALSLSPIHGRPQNRDVLVGTVVQLQHFHTKEERKKKVVCLVLPYGLLDFTYTYTLVGGMLSGELKRVDFLNILQCVEAHTCKGGVFKIWSCLLYFQSYTMKIKSNTLQRGQTTNYKQ